MCHPPPLLVNTCSRIKYDVDQRTDFQYRQPPKMQTWINNQIVCQIFYITLKKNGGSGGGTATSAEIRHYGQNVFLPFLTELDISKNIFWKKNVGLK